MRKHLTLILALFALLVSCKSEFSFDQDLSLTSEKVELDAAEGMTPVIVYANGAWTATLTEGSDWASLEGASGRGMGQVRFHYSANTGIARRAVIEISSGGDVRSVAMVQKSGLGEVSFGFASKGVDLPRNGASGELSLFANLPDSEMDKVQVDVRTDEGAAVDWVSGVALSQSAVEFTVSANETGAERVAIISLSYADVIGTEYTSTLRLSQKDAAPYLSFPEEVLGVRQPSLSSVVTIPVITNLLPYLGNMVKKAAQTAPSWAQVSLPADGSAAFLITLEENTASTDRVANLDFSFTDSNGTTAPFSYTLTQKKKAPRLSFADVKALAASGVYEFTDDGTIEGVVISDMDSPNIETAPNLNPAELDTSLNGVSAYLQTPDADEGLRLVFASRADNSLHRGARISLDLNGVTVRKETNPDRYTIEGITQSAVSMGVSETPKVKEKKLSDLTDKDLYTLVKITGLEMSFKHGAYTNCHDGYAAPVTALNPAGEKTNVGWSGSPQKSDTTPCSMTDAMGNEINLLINNGVTWRRYGNGVPQGTCSVTGILVHTDLIRWARNGWLGSYQLRPLEESDIESTGDAFSKEIVSWYKGWDEEQKNGSDAIAAGLHGTATITSNVGSIQTSVGFNDLTNYSSDPVKQGYYKGMVKNGALGFVKTGGYFWGSSDINNMDDAPWFCIKFSTEGLSGSNLVLIWSAAQGSTRGATDDIQGPTQYRVEYSTDGSTFTAVDHLYAMHPIVTNSDSLRGGFSVPGLHQYVTKLPASLLGKSEVWVRVRAASNKSLDDAYLTPEGGTIKNYSSPLYTMVRFGEITLRYN